MTLSNRKLGMYCIQMLTFILSERLAKISLFIVLGTFSIGAYYIYMGVFSFECWRGDREI